LAKESETLALFGDGLPTPVISALRSQVYRLTFLNELSLARTNRLEGF
jgi:hypothetical protein